MARSPFAQSPDMSTRKPSSSPSTPQAEVVLLPNLKNCLVNLPATLVSVLLNANTLAQNVVVELSWRGQDQKDAKQKLQRSVFLGWTGMGSQRKEGGLVGREGIKAGSVGAQDTVEVDATLARLIGLVEGLKVRSTWPFEPGGFGSIRAGKLRR